MEAIDIINGIKEKKIKYLAKGISLVENGNSMSNEIINNLFSNTRHAHYVGITGNPGAGKSTLINQLARYYLQDGKKVAVLAVDPSSPISGGAVLGDRIRMDSDLMGEDFYFRSISNRSHLGGISSTTYESVLLLDAFGFDVILIETVGTGQSETNIMNISHTNLVVTVPGLGDDVQMEKAGLLEVGDLFVVNKEDLVGAKEVKGQLKRMISLRSYVEWKPKVILTNALNGSGITKLITAVKEHGSLARKTNMDRAESFLREKIEQQITQEMLRRLDEYFEQHSPCVKEFVERKISHVEIAKRCSDMFFQSLKQKENE